MKKSFLLFAALIVSISVMAVPARKGAITVEQPDGSTIQIFQHGDEHFHYTTNARGEWVRQDENGMYVLTTQLTEEQIRARRMNSPKLKAQLRRMQQATQTEIPLNIAEHGLIILVNFSDKSFKAANTLSAMQQMHSGDTYTYNGATGSARQYFYDQSMGKYNPQFDVVGPVTVSQKMAYYGANDSEDMDMRPEEMIVEACKLADSEFNVDFTKYDNDGDGEVDFVYVIYAGYGEADSGIENTIWPHAYTLTDAGKSLRLDGKEINTYACGSELNYEGNREGIGTFCHEFSHVCGLPDLYATNYASHKTLGEWDILDAGPYNNDGNTPPAYSAYERFFCGWLTPEYINSEAELTLEQIQTSNKAYIITTDKEPNLKGNDPQPTTFYLIENRQQTQWDKYLPGHGMMLTKITYNYNTWTQNTVNDKASSVGVDIIEADGKAPTMETDEEGYTVDNGYLGKATDLFPAGATSYTKITNRPITQIKENNGVISFKFMDSGSTTPIEDNKYISVTEALEIAQELEQGATSTDSIDVYGEITSITEVSTKYGNATFTISDGTSEIYCFRLYSLGNKKFTSESEIQVGDKVIVRSLAQNYVAKGSTTSTYELVKGYIKSLNPITAVENVQTDYQLIAADGMLYVLGNENHAMQVFNTVGQIIYNGNAATLNLQHGLYIVKIDNAIYKVNL